MLEACCSDGMAGKSFVGGGGSGPIGGGCLLGNVLLPGPNLIELLLLVRGGNIGLCVFSIADAGSGILSRLLKPRRLDRGTLPLRASCVSSERCCNESGGGGDRWAIPIGADVFCPPAVTVGYCGDSVSNVGLSIFLAVKGVLLASTVPKEELEVADVAGVV